MRISSSLTFKPATTPSRVRSHLESSSAMSGSVPVYERLSMSAQKKRAELDAARKRKEDTERATCTFKPNLSASKHSARLVGISSSDHDRSVEGSSDPYTRLYAHALERVQRLQEEPRPEDLGCTFKPAISSVSRRISETMRDPSTVDLPRHYMLYEDGLQKQQARSMEAANKGGAITEDDVANCTFHPAVSPLPAHTAASIPVYDRLYENARAKQITLAAAASGVVLPTSPVYMQERFGSEEAAHSEAASRTGGAPPGSSAGSKEMFYI
ncbi:hypothetical protein EON67_03705 [archaeon]|nr:MAG: hypothetical protein EON67_03705 [archaeon]